MPYRGGIYTAGTLYFFKQKLAFARKAIAYLAPVDEVFTVENRHTRKVFEGARNDVIIFAGPANARVRIKT